MRSYVVDLDAPLFRFGQCPLLESTFSASKTANQATPLIRLSFVVWHHPLLHRITLLHLPLKIHLTNRVALAATVLSLMTHMALKTGLPCDMNHYG
jgi:hypothetical protein